MRCLALLLTGLCGLLGQAHAQGMDVQLAPSTAVACMTPPVAQRGEPEYPFEPWKRGEGGRVLVELTFTGKDIAPKVKVLEKSGDSTLTQAVEAHIGSFRVPCLEFADIPLRLRQLYVFEPDQRKVSWTVPVDTADTGRREQLRCMASNDGSKGPEYPARALREGVVGNVLARLQFTAPDQPPTVTSYGGSLAMKRLAANSESYAAKLRLPCMVRPVEALMLFKYRLDGNSLFGFKNITLTQWLGTVKGIKEMRARFDTNDMGCPFDVKLLYLQPHLPNLVGRFDAPDTRRQALLEWLSTHELDLKPEQFDAVFGDEVTFTIPCIKIDLKPKE